MKQDKIEVGFKIIDSVSEKLRELCLRKYGTDDLDECRELLGGD
jgi:hypothetical protein